MKTEIFEAVILSRDPGPPSFSFPFFFLFFLFLLPAAAEIVSSRKEFLLRRICILRHDFLFSLSFLLIPYPCDLSFRSLIPSTAIHSRKVKEISRNSRRGIKRKKVEGGKSHSATSPLHVRSLSMPQDRNLYTTTHVHYQKGQSGKTSLIPSSFPPFPPSPENLGTLHPLFSSPNPLPPSPIPPP